MKKFVLCLSVLSSLFICTLTNNIHAEEGMSIEDVVISETNKPVTFSYDLNQRLSEVKNRLDSYIIQNFKITPDKYSPDYLSVLNKISLDANVLNTTEEEKAAFSALATIYVGRISSLIHDNMSESEKNDINEIEDNILNRTFLEIRNENIRLIKDIADAKKKTRRKRSVSNFHEPSATAYALKYALSVNPRYGSFSILNIGPGDCTNFASQIMEAGGMEQTYFPNSSGLNWYFANYFARSKSWAWAHGFMQYWTAEGARTASFTSTSSAIPHIRKGNFIGYWDKSLFEFSHMAYVNNVSNGKVYICQHTDDRKNALWNNISWGGFNSITVLSVG